MSTQVGIPLIPLTAVGVSTLGNTAGVTGAVNGTLAMVGLGGVSLSQATAPGAATISISAPGMTGAFYQNFAPAIASLGAVLQLITTGDSSLRIFPAEPLNSPFPFNISASQFALDINHVGFVFNWGVFTGTGTSTVSRSVSLSLSGTLGLSIGLYILSGGTALSLINSAASNFSLSQSTSKTAGSALSSNFGQLAATGVNGPLWQTFHSSQFSSLLSLSAGQQYCWGMIFSSSVAQASVVAGGSGNGANLNFGGTFQFVAQDGYAGTQGSRSGTFGVASSSAASLGGYQIGGVYSSTTLAFPTTIPLSSIDRTANTDGLEIPHYILNNVLAAL